MDLCHIIPSFVWHGCAAAKNKSKHKKINMDALLINQSSPLMKWKMRHSERLSKWKMKNKRRRPWRQCWRKKIEIMPGKCNENNIEIITLCILDTLITEQISARERLNCDATSGVVFQEKKNWYVFSFCLRMSEWTPNIPKYTKWGRYSPELDTEKKGRRPYSCAAKNFRVK